MRWRDRIVDFVRRLSFNALACLLGLVLGMVAGGFAHAQTSGSVQVQALSNRWEVTTPGGVATSMEAQAYFNNSVSKYGGSTLYKKLGFETSSATLGSLAKGIVKKGVGAYLAYETIKGIIDGAGWAIDELQKQVIVPGDPGTSLGPKAYCIQISNGTYRCSNAPGQLSPVAHLYNPTNFTQPCSAVKGYSSAFPNDYYYFCKRSDGATVPTVKEDVYNMPSTGWPETMVPFNSTEDQPVSDQQLGDAIKPHPEVVNAVLVDPQTGQPVRYPEMVDVLNDWKTELEQEHQLEPTPGVEPDTDYTDTEDNVESEWPGFCSWAKVVCEFIDWVKRDPDQAEPIPVPWQESPVVQQTWNSGIGNGSCPAPISFSVSIGGMSVSPEFELRPVCDFAVLMRPLILAIAAVIAVYIVAGLRQSKDG